MSTMPTRIDGDLFEAAKAAGKVHSRSAAQRLGHWARLGRELERSPSVTHDAIERVLAGELAYDETDDCAQTLVLGGWDERTTARIASLDLADELADSGLPWSEADADGNIVAHGPGTPAA